MKQLNTNLMNQPLDYQCSFRIDQLCSYYGRLQVFKTSLAPGRLLNQTDLSELERHILNLRQHVGPDCFFETINLIFNTELKKVG